MSRPSRSLLLRMMSGKGARLAEHAPLNRRYVASSVLKNKNQESVAANEDEGMNQVLQIVYLARHGETAWTLSGQYTGLTDLPLTERGERNARHVLSARSEEHTSELQSPYDV